MQILMSLSHYCQQHTISSLQMTGVTKIFHQSYRDLFIFTCFLYVLVIR